MVPVSQYTLYEYADLAELPRTFSQFKKIVKHKEVPRVVAAVKAFPKTIATCFDYELS